MSRINPTNRFTTKIVQLIAGHTPRCKEITQLLSQSLDRPLSLRQKILIHIHFLVCEWCERYGRQLRVLRRISRKFAEKEGEKGDFRLSAAGRDRIRRALKEHPNETQRLK